MAHSPRKDKVAESIWRNTKAKCPICKNQITHWYCPNCGVSKNNSGYINYENEIFQCGSSHFHRGISIEEYKLCDKCRTPNPNNANYCRCCGDNIATQARDKFGHGWVDLGLSVLWSTESLSRHFTWNDSTIINDDDTDQMRKSRESYVKLDCGLSGGKDAATYWWGKDWRTPTKKELEELVTKCKWEKYIIPTTTEFALKAIGPNGNSIIFLMNSSGAHHQISLWSSTPKDNMLAYRLGYHEEVEFKSTLTPKQKKRREFWESNNIRFKVEHSIDETLSFFRDSLSRINKDEEIRRKTYPQYEKVLEQQRKILDEMGDDAQEIEKNRKEDLKRFHKSWLNSPIKIAKNANGDIDSVGTLRIAPARKYYRCEIRPVADKK